MEPDPSTAYEAPPGRLGRGARSHEEIAIGDLFEGAHQAAPHELPELFARTAAGFGVRDVAVYLADLQQAALLPFVSSAGPPEGAQVEALSIDSTLAGRAFQHTAAVLQPVDDTDDETRVWLPLLNGTERLGVMSMVAFADAELEDSGSEAMARLRLFARLVGELVMTKTMYGDTIVRLRRTGDMGLAAEMQWSLLPPLTFASAVVTIAAGLEPAYDVAGDSIDYAVDPAAARLAIFDGMGHGLRSALLVSLAVAAYRNGRRGGRGLSQTARNIDATVTSSFEGDAFATGILAELDTDSGLLTWLNAGHPEPLLLRGGSLVKSLHVEPTLPFGWGNLQGDGLVQLGTEALEPGDIVLFYSDGVVEARSPEGDFFGQERLVDLLTRSLAAGLPAPETMRRLVRSLLDHQQGQLSDDATLLVVEWRGVSTRSGPA